MAEVGLLKGPGMPRYAQENLYKRRVGALGPTGSPLQFERLFRNANGVARSAPMSAPCTLCHTHTRLVSSSMTYDADCLLLFGDPSIQESV